MEKDNQSRPHLDNEHCQDEVNGSHGEKAASETEPQHNAGEATDAVALDGVGAEGPGASEIEPEHTVDQDTDIDDSALDDLRTEDPVDADIEPEHTVHQENSTDDATLDDLDDVRTENILVSEIVTENTPSGAHAAALDEVTTEGSEEGEGKGKALSHLDQQVVSNFSPDTSEVASQDDQGNPIVAVKAEPEDTVDQVTEEQSAGVHAASLEDVTEDTEEGEGKKEPLAHVVQRQVSNSFLNSTEAGPEDGETNPIDASQSIPPLDDGAPMEISGSALHSKDLIEDFQVEGDEGQNQVDTTNDEVTDSGNTVHKEGVVQSSDHVHEKISSADGLVCFVEDSDLASQSGEACHRVDANVEELNPVITGERVSVDQERSVNADLKEVLTHIIPDKEVADWDEVKDDVNGHVSDKDVVADTLKEDLHAFEELGSNRKDHEEQSLNEVEHGVSSDDRREALKEASLLMEDASTSEELRLNRSNNEEQALKGAECAVFSKDREETVKEEKLLLEDAPASLSSERKVTLMPSDDNGDPCVKGNLFQISSMDYCCGIEDEAKGKNVQEELPIEDMKINDNVVQEVVFLNDGADSVSHPSAIPGHVGQEESLLNESVARDVIMFEEVSTSHHSSSAPIEVIDEEAHLSESLSREVIVNGHGYGADQSSAVNGPTASTSTELDSDHTQLISPADSTSQDEVSVEDSNKFVSWLRVPLMVAVAIAVTGIAVAFIRRN